MNGRTADELSTGDACVIVEPRWPAPSQVRAAATTRWLAGASRAPYAAFNLGARCGDEPDAVIANRRALHDRLCLPASPRWLHQVHGSDVLDAVADGASVHARSGDISAEPRADAAVTEHADVVLAILSADCLPVLVCADDGSVIGAAHAGWRGLAGGVIEATVAKMLARRAGLRADRLLAWLGPAIGGASYEVGDEVRAAFVAADAAASAAFAPTRAGHWLCDLYALARLRLARLGIARVFGGDFDTFADPRFYSYRRAPRTGRFASLIWRTRSP